MINELVCLGRPAVGTGRAGKHPSRLQHSAQSSRRSPLTSVPSRSSDKLRGPPTSWTSRRGRGVSPVRPDRNGRGLAIRHLWPPTLQPGAARRHGGRTRPTIAGWPRAAATLSSGRRDTNPPNTSVAMELDPTRRSATVRKEIGRDCTDVVERTARNGGVRIGRAATDRGTDVESVDPSLSQSNRSAARERPTLGARAPGHKNVRSSTAGWCAGGELGNSCPAPRPRRGGHGQDWSSYQRG